MRIRLVVPEGDVGPATIDPALEAVTKVNERLIRRGLPTAEEAIATGKYKWKPEPPGDEHFDRASTILKRGWGDCDDWAPYHAASLRVTGEDPGARAFIRRSGPGRWHALVARSDGTTDDPSRWAGMGKGINGPGSEGAVVPGSAPVEPGLAMRMHRGIWVARAETPLNWERSGCSGLAIHGAMMNPAELAVNSCHGAAVVAGQLRDEEHARNWCAMRDMVSGVHPHHVSDRHALDAWALYDRMAKRLPPRLRADIGAGFGFQSLLEKAQAPKPAGTTMERWHKQANDMVMQMDGFKRMSPAEQQRSLGGIQWIAQEIDKAMGDKKSNLGDVHTRLANDLKTWTTYSPAEREQLRLHLAKIFEDANRMQEAQNAPSWLSNIAHAIPVGTLASLVPGGAAAYGALSDIYQGKNLLDVAKNAGMNSLKGAIPGGSFAWDAAQAVASGKSPWDAAKAAAMKQFPDIASIYPGGPIAVNVLKSYAGS